MPNFAQITVIGHLGRDPESRTTPNGNNVTQFSMATSKKRGQQESTTWWRVSLWGKRGETLAQYLRKGDPVLITGEPYMSTYTGQDGVERHNMEIDARDFSFVGGKSEKPKTDFQAPDRRKSEKAGDFDDDMPF